MDIKEILQLDHSKANRDIIVNWIGSDQKRFDKLLDFVLENHIVISPRAAWSLSYSAQANPGLVIRHLGKLIKNLKKPKLHDAVKRNTLRFLEEIAIPERFHGVLMNTCFDYIISPNEKPAIKAFSLTILANLARQYPEIKHELKTIIEVNWDNESPAFKSRARKILSNL
jgi:hypothetical protein